MDAKKPLIFIHGWGLNSEVFRPVVNLLSNDHKIYVLDLPGFGNTPIEKVMFLRDYAEYVHKFLKEKNIEKPIIIGHSFGGAVAAKLTLIYPESISKLILVSASAIRQPNIKTKIFRKISELISPLLPEKLKKSILKSLNMEKSDYAVIRNPNLKNTFKNIINENLAFELSKIKIPTLVIWGEKDTTTPIKEGEEIAELIPNAKLAVIKNTGHFLFLEKPKEFTELIKNFLHDAI